MGLEREVFVDHLGEVVLAQLPERFGQIVHHEAVVVGEQLIEHFRHFPPGQVEVQPVDERKDYDNPIALKDGNSGVQRSVSGPKLNTGRWLRSFAQPLDHLLGRRPEPHNKVVKDGKQTLGQLGDHFCDGQMSSHTTATRTPATAPARPLRAASLPTTRVKKAGLLLVMGSLSMFVVLVVRVAAGGRRHGWLGQRSQSARRRFWGYRTTTMRMTCARAVSRAPMMAMMQWIGTRSSKEVWWAPNVLMPAI